MKKKGKGATRKMDGNIPTENRTASNMSAAKGAVGKNKSGSTKLGHKSNKVHGHPSGVRAQRRHTYA